MSPEEEQVQIAVSRTLIRCRHCNHKNRQPIVDYLPGTQEIEATMVCRKCQRQQRVEFRVKPRD